MSGNHSPLPWKPNDTKPGRWDIDTANDYVVTSAEWSGIRSQRDRDFIIVSANYHERMADLVRRIVDWDKKYPKGMIHSYHAEKEHDAIADDAAALWAEYQKEVQP
jgi:hypothetical protein